MPQRNQVNRSGPPHVNLPWCTHDRVSLTHTLTRHDVLPLKRAWRIQGSSVGTVAELKEVIALARAGKIKPIPIEKRPLAEVSRTLDQLKAGSIVGRVVAAID